MLDGGEDVEEVVHQQGLSCVPEIIRIELTSHFGIEKSSRACCQGVSITDTYLSLKRLKRDYLCLPIGRIRATIRSFSTSAYKMSQCK